MWMPTTEATKVHDHPLTAIGRWMTLACDLCGKEDKSMPYLCTTCGFGIHTRFAHFPGRLKVVWHDHPLNPIHSLELHQSNSQFCQLCFQKMNTNYGLYYCSKCNFVAHLDCAISWRNMEDINLLEIKEEDSTESKAMLHEHEEIATEIKHFSHKHDLKLIDEVPNNKICDGCVRAILTPSFYNCVDCIFFLHISCTKLPKIKQHPLHQHPLTLTYSKSYKFRCDACYESCNGFSYHCQICNFDLNVHCSLTSNTLTHACHEYRLYLSIPNHKQKCSICGFERYQVFRCTTCDFVLDFKCATLPQVHGTTSMSNPSLYVIIQKMTLVSITVTSVKKNEIPSNGSTTVKIAVILLISNVFLGKTQITRNTNNGHLFGDLHINLTVKKISMTQMIYESL